jgi:hypothetical protein
MHFAGLPSKCVVQAEDALVVDVRDAGAVLVWQGAESRKATASAVDS